MNALDLYREDAALRASGQPLTDRQQYYLTLRDALYGELTASGFSPLLEEVYMAMRQGDINRLYALDYAALMECYSLIVDHQRLRDALAYVPHLLKGEEKVPWDALYLPGSQMVPISAAVAEKFRTLRTVSNKMYSARTTGYDGGATEPPNALAQYLKVAQLLEERCKRLEAERDVLKDRVKALEDGVIDAQLARRIEGRYAQEEEALQAEYAQRREEARVAFRAQYGQELSERRRRQEDEARAAAALLGEIPGAYAEVRQGMAEELGRLCRQVEEQMQRWQHQLDRTEYRMLAASYGALHTLLTTDMDALVLEAQHAQAPEGVCTAAVLLQGKAWERLRQLEQALQRLGLGVIRPEAGDAFDEKRHCAVGVADAMAKERQVAQCIQPGVIHLGTGETLLPATVKTNEQGEGQKGSRV